MSMNFTRSARVMPQNTYPTGKQSKKSNKSSSSTIGMIRRNLAVIMSHNQASLDESRASAIVNAWTAITDKLESLPAKSDLHHQLEAEITKFYNGPQIDPVDSNREVRKRLVKSATNFLQAAKARKQQLALEQAAREEQIETLLGEQVVLKSDFKDKAQAYLMLDMDVLKAYVREAKKELRKINKIRVKL